jgi:hypothetical protein
VATGWRRLHNEELGNLYSSLNIIRVITSRRLRWIWDTSRMENVRNALTGKSEEERDYVGDLGIDGRLILILIVKGWGVNVRNGFIWFQWWVVVNRVMKLSVG